MRVIAQGGSAQQVSEWGCLSSGCRSPVPNQQNFFGVGAVGTRKCHQRAHLHAEGSEFLGAHRSRQLEPLLGPGLGMNELVRASVFNGRTTITRENFAARACDRVFCDMWHHMPSSGSGTQRRDASFSCRTLNTAARRECAHGRCMHATHGRSCHERVVCGAPINPTGTATFMTSSKDTDTFGTPLY